MYYFYIIEEMNDKLKVTSLFTGIGGIDMGFDGEVIVHKDSVENKEFMKAAKESLLWKIA